MLGNYNMLVLVMEPITCNEQIESTHGIHRMIAFLQTKVTRFNTPFVLVLGVHRVVVLKTLNFGIPSDEVVFVIPFAKVGHVYMMASIIKCSYIIYNHNGFWIFLTLKIHKKMRYNSTLKG